MIVKLGFIALIGAVLIISLRQNLVVVIIGASQSFGVHLFNFHADQKELSSHGGFGDQADPGLGKATFRLKTSQEGFTVESPIKSDHP